jgi:serine/threonine protein kinase
LAENDLENVDFHIKLADFGLSKKVLDLNDTSKTVCGTPLYMSPQMITKTSYTSRTDIWSLGVVVFELMTGKTPFYSSNKAQFEDKIQEGNYNFNLGD